MEDVLQIRKALDELAVGLACDNLKEEDLEKLHVALKNFEASTRGHDVKRIAQADVEFHDVIYQATDNPKLVNMLNNLREQIYRYRVEYLKNEDIYPTLIHEHEKIFDCLKRKDKDEVIRVMSYHVVNQEMMVKNIIREQE